MCRTRSPEFLRDIFTFTGSVNRMPCTKIGSLSSVKCLVGFDLTAFRQYWKILIHWAILPYSLLLHSTVGFTSATSQKNTYPWPIIENNQLLIHGPWHMLLQPEILKNLYWLTSSFSEQIQVNEPVLLNFLCI